MTKKIKLNSLAENILSEREMKAVVGGTQCGCGCSWSSDIDNGSANYAGGKNSIGKIKTILLDEVEARP